MRNFSVDSSDFDPLLPVLEATLVKSGRSQTAFGHEFFGDPALFGKARRGRRFHKLRTRIRELATEFGVTDEQIEQARLRLLSRGSMAEPMGDVTADDLLS